MDQVTKTKLKSVKMSAAMQDKELGKFYARHNCKKCNGHGTLVYEIPPFYQVKNQYDKIVSIGKERIQLCDCVVKKIQKEIDSIQ